MNFKVIDLFAGPGGLGEGFASFNNGKSFSIATSVEMESSAHQTLSLRSFFRHAVFSEDLKSLSAYYNFCNSNTANHPRDVVSKTWDATTSEAKRLTLGNDSDNIELDKILKCNNLKEEGTVLIGGPPCQAYSLVGRSRNMGNSDYIAENDHRHFLYREYLKILHKTRPIIFVMENVKGIISAKVGGRQIFHDIIRDLTDPGKALGKGTGLQYTLHSLVMPIKFEPGMDPRSINARDFTIQAEDYGIPQTRHRVIILGVRKEINYQSQYQLVKTPHLSVRTALEGIPQLRSKLSYDDAPGRWWNTIRQVGSELANDALEHKKILIEMGLRASIKNLSTTLDTGALRYRNSPNYQSNNTYQEWVRDPKLEVWLNHETRSHMTSDLGRYLYAAVFAQENGYSPKGHQDFSLKGLAPDHANWETGKFSDRFRVQRYESPSSTITSHISKDGHYFIHPDPTQCRSLTVREAARLQTFPDNYFFQGNRTQQYHQVGNAVPALLAQKIANICHLILSDKN